MSSCSISPPLSTKAAATILRQSSTTSPSKPVTSISISVVSSVIVVRIRSDGEIEDFISRLRGSKSVDFLSGGAIDAELLEEDEKK